MNRGAAEEVGVCLVLRTRLVVGPAVLRAPRNVAEGGDAPKHV